MLQMPLRQSNTSVTFHKITQTALAMDPKWILSRACHKYCSAQTISCSIVLAAIRHKFLRLTRFTLYKLTWSYQIIMKHNVVILRIKFWISYFNYEHTDIKNISTNKTECAWQPIAYATSWTTDRWTTMDNDRLDNGQR